jgi:hypothetical protein
MIAVYSFLVATLILFIFNLVNNMMVLSKKNADASVVGLTLFLSLILISWNIIAIVVLL